MQQTAVASAIHLANTSATFSRWTGRSSSAMLIREPSGASRRSNRSESATAREQSDVLGAGAAFETSENSLLGLWRPEDPQVLTCPGDGRVENAVRDVIFVGVGDDDLDGVVFEALCLMDRDSVGDLERHGGVERVVVLVAGVVVVDGEAHSRAFHPYQLSTDDIELAEWSIELDVELDLAGGERDVDDPALQVVVDYRPKPLGLVE